MKEYILCAAIWYKELPSQRMQCKNTDSGIVICGHRHGQIIDILHTLSKLRTVRYSKDGVGESVQGFLTSLNRFVDRKEAAEIAYSAGQISEQKTTLFSEDIY